jgi:hypothetical protein
VVYLHHTRDRDGDVVFYFLERERGGDQPLQSSPIVSIKRGVSAVLDVKGRGNLGRYTLVTQNTEYEVQMPHDKADHLARELATR